MSYCRFSSLNWMCDVYVYEDATFGGWTTHVAGNRLIFAPIPTLPVMPLFGGTWDREARRIVYPSRWRERLARACTHLWLASPRLTLWCLDVIPRRPIGLKHDGESFSDGSPGDCADRLLRPRAIGYRVPDSAIAALQAEQRAIDAQVDSHADQA